MASGVEATVPEAVVGAAQVAHSLPLVAPPGPAVIVLHLCLQYGLGKIEQGAAPCSTNCCFAFYKFTSTGPHYQSAKIFIEFKTSLCFTITILPTIVTTVTICNQERGFRGRRATPKPTEPKHL